MGLYDVIDEIAEKQVLKTETGDNRIFGVLVGVVAKNYDKDMPGRVCVTVPVRDKDANELKWARLAMPSSGRGWGHYFLPEVGDQVLLAFEQGNIEKPYVVGCVPKDNNKFLTKAVDENNQFKKIITKNGNSIIFEDNSAGEGEKDKITIHTAGEQHSICLDNEKKKISITDKDGGNQIVLMTESGKMNITAAQSLTIKVGDTITLKMNGSSGAVQLECGKLTVNANSGLQLESGGFAKLAGATIKVEASSALNASSSGLVQIQGTPIKIG